MLQRTWVRILLLAVPIAVIAGAVLLRDTAVQLAKEVIPPCVTYERLGIYCPGCGVTRCILALMQGNLWLALRNNAAIIALLFMLVLLYAEAVLLSFGKDIHLLPRKSWFWIAFGSCAAVYFAARNFIPELMPVPVNL